SWNQVAKKGTLQVWKPETNTLCWRQEVSGPVRRAAFSPDSKRVAAATSLQGQSPEAKDRGVAGGLKGWDVEAKRALLTQQDDLGVNWVAFSSPKGRFAVFVGEDRASRKGAAVLWEAEKGETWSLKAQKGTDQYAYAHEEGILHAAFSADDRAE